ncbi:hypothetical protein F5Y15DRAFT_367903 [Xylariaceae sp. FL0016]|nr:hypothetical protein F5Y15DRAFT_367903 [Xylariaceae sp. FL0016]
MQGARARKWGKPGSQVHEMRRSARAASCAAGGGESHCLRLSCCAVLRWLMKYLHSRDGVSWTNNVSYAVLAMLGHWIVHSLAGDFEIRGGRGPVDWARRSVRGSPGVPAPGGLRLFGRRLSSIPTSVALCVDSSICSGVLGMGFYAVRSRMQFVVPDILLCHIVCGAPARPYR